MGRLIVWSVTVTESKLLSCRMLVVLRVLVLAGCRTYEYTPTVPSAEFEESKSLGSIEVRYAHGKDDSPTLHSAFRRNVIEPDLGFVGTYVFGMVYPTMKIDENYSSVKLKGEALGEGHWRFLIPRKSGWNGPQDLNLYFANRDLFLFRFLEGQSCLSEYSLDTPGREALQIKISFKEPGCLLPCSPSQNDPNRCSHLWR
ncbi:hypothetical protein [Ectopseudomonas guguanensis]|jgi:hypothetical protein|uniref:Lipoprotein n=1 Tax=Ectopseudomonas guguanensis TaxID=1198456 RepID=A0A1H0WYH9_9GAMM|nr:hypothetical protein [Pseudomonas guguanensis]SDP95737.1 hypothetical protein SAMN05216213_108170 [Pseudomonas guguanensis]